MDIQKVDYSIFNGIAKEYIENSNFRDKYFGYDFKSNDDILARCDVLKSQEFHRNDLVAALKDINAAYGAGQKTIQNIQSLADNDALCVVTGQQVGIFGGSLYTLYKAATTIKMAKKYSALTGLKVVPIFWIASEDHDFEEIRSFTFFDDDRLKTLKMDKKAGWANKNPYKTSANYRDIQEPAKIIDVNESLFNISENLTSAIASFPNGDWVKEVFIDSLSQNDSISDWFAKVYLKIFEDEGLIIIDPMNPDIRRLGSSFLNHALNTADDIIQVVKHKTDSLYDLGFNPIINLRENISGLYLIEDGERKTLFKSDDNRYYTQDGDSIKWYEKKDLIYRIANNPEDFSTNVILRPVIQDVYLPTIAYVAGPGELAYYAQLGDVYKIFEKSMPIIVPRENYTYRIYKDKINMLEHDVNFVEILNSYLYEKERELLKNCEPIDIENLFVKFKGEVDKLHDELINNLSVVSEEIIKLQSDNRRLIENQIQYLEKKAYRFHRKKHRSNIEFLSELYSRLRPNNKLQERTICTADLLAHGGKQIIKFLTSDIEYSYWHRLIDFNDKY